MYMKNGLNKSFAPLPGTEKFLGGSTRSLAYTDHIIQFGLNSHLKYKIWHMFSTSSFVDNSVMMA